MRIWKGGTAVTQLAITILTKGLGSGISTETEAILTVNITLSIRELTIERRATIGILTAAVRQDPEMMKVDQVIQVILQAITIHTAVPAKASEEEVLIITLKVVLMILLAREVRIPIPEAVEAETLAVVGAEILTVAVAEVDLFTAAVVEAVTFIAVMVIAGGVMVPPGTTRIIRAITRWYRCLERHETAPDRDAARPSVLPRRDRGDHQE